MSLLLEAKKIEIEKNEKEIKKKLDEFTSKEKVYSQPALTETDFELKMMSKILKF
jgi:hypothetical protein